MTSSSAASTLSAAVSALRPRQELSSEPELIDYFVDRPFTPRQRMAALLRADTQPQKLLFTGHRGNGKSTELRKLALELDGIYYCVTYSVLTVTNLFDITYIDVLLSIGLRLMQEATRQGMGVPAKEFTPILEFARGIPVQIESGQTTTIESGGELGVFAGKLLGKLAKEDSTRETIRANLGPKIDRLTTCISDLARAISRRQRRPLLIIVEDLDKLDPEPAGRVFYGQANALAAPEVSIIYTFPIALRHHKDFPQIKISFPQVYDLPNISAHLRSPADQYDQQALQCLRELITRRVAARLFDEAALALLVEECSGIPRELITIAQDAATDALGSGAAAVEIAHVQAALNRAKADYQRNLEPAELELLRQIQAGAVIPNDEAHRGLLHGLSLLEYLDADGPWYDVHPLVKQLLQ